MSQVVSNGLKTEIMFQEIEIMSTAAEKSFDYNMIIWNETVQMGPSVLCFDAAGTESRRLLSSAVAEIGLYKLVRYQEPAEGNMPDLFR